MKLEEVLPALREGKKIRRANDWWIERYGYQSLKFLPEQELSGEDILAEDWEEVEEWREVAINAFYNKHPELRPPRPVKEQEYKFFFSVYRKLNGSAYFEDEPLSELEMVASADGADADIATNCLLEDFDKDGALYASLKDPLKETIEGILKKWDKSGWFHERGTLTVDCSLEDKHEFLVVADIEEVK